ncbi:MAG TPA: chaperone modulator CbpM [Ktedonobacteraceae bacterium]|nr:chaperone modulator CbpM [Ktedonobacteraceae bacterium]
MNESHFTRIIIQDNQGTTYYSEQETAEFSQMEVQMLRRLRHAGLIQGIEVADEEPRYNDADVALLRRIRRLHRDLGINLAGIEVILRLSAHIEALQRELEQRQHGV